jgi:hypothetical protein
VRNVIQLQDGSFAAFQFKGGTRLTYLIPTSDSLDAHDFGSEDEANRWLQSRRLEGNVVELTDSGHWPCED